MRLLQENIIQIPASITNMGRSAFAYQDLTNRAVSLEIGTNTQGSRLHMPVLNAYEEIQNRAWQIGANNGHAWDSITFWSDGTYTGNVEIADISGVIRGRLAEYLGLLRDNQ